jgi:hypothetical protein
MRNLGVTGAYVFWCSRCGTVRDYAQDGRSDTVVPMLVGRVKDLRWEMGNIGIFLDQDRQRWHRLGIFEAIAPQDERETT